jgi:Uma2 family endonuclease
MGQPAELRRPDVSEELPLAKTWTAEEYLAFERRSETKHEYAGGKVTAMAGASRAHNLLVLNISHLLAGALADRPCEAYPSDMRVRIPATGDYRYPDASALCGPPEFEDQEFDTLTNPEVIFEVLSESTEDRDRGEKFDDYRSIAALKEYVLVSQQEVLVERFTRQADGSWTKREFGAGDVFELSSVRCTLEVDEIYRKVFSAPKRRAE